MVALGTIVDLKAFRFSVTSRRAAKIQSSIATLKAAVARNPSAVPAKLIASFIGLIWSIAPCCHRAASVMVRAITAVLTQGLHCRMRASRLTLSMIMNRFWSGSVKWSSAASHQLDFWSLVKFVGLSAHISADILGVAVEQAFWYPSDLNPDNVSFLAQDASATASGGGLMHMLDGALHLDAELFLAEFTQELACKSSTL